MASTRYDRTSDVKDYSSLSNCEEFSVEHIDLDWTVDFSTKTIAGTATLSLMATQTTLDTIVLDTRDLTVTGVHVDGVAASFKLGKVDEVFGAPLQISGFRGVAPGKSVNVAVAYSTSPESSALQWLDPGQTAGKRHPYLFSQCQAIHARSMLPCVDAPGHKSTYTASVRVPDWATVLMSALQKGDGRAASSSSSKETGMKEFTWEQPVACSSYLIAIAVGDLEKVEISSRCRVWSEPSMVAEASDEFSQTEDFLKAAEKLAGPYRWTRYDLLCLPPSFPYGGMENPCLTFVTPTLLAGDKSLADVVAHEIAHSWTGNLVTNATWTHFWLNEGWTRWFELSIMAEIQGDDRYFDLRASLGYEGLKDDVQRYLEAGEPEMTCLVPPLEGIDPDDSFSSVPYERGMNFLFYLQRKVGKAAFQSFFKAYVLEYASKTITSHGFRLFFESHFAANPNAKGVDWETWLVSPGMLPEEPVYDLSLLDDVKALAADFVAGKNDGCSSTNPPKQDFNAWPSLQQQLFLQTLLDAADSSGPLRMTTLDALEDLYGLTSKKNSELRFKWCKLCLKSGRTQILRTVADFLVSQGRMKFTRPLYRCLMDTPAAGGQELALGTFAANKDIYHPICRKMVASDMAKAVDRKKEAASSEEYRAGLSFGLGVAAAVAVVALVAKARS